MKRFFLWLLLLIAGISLGIVIFTLQLPRTLWRMIRDRG